MTSLRFALRHRRRRTLVDVLVDSLRRPDPLPAPPVDLLQILMGQPG